MNQGTHSDELRDVMAEVTDRAAAGEVDLQGEYLRKYPHLASELLDFFELRGCVRDLCHDGSLGTEKRGELFGTLGDFQIVRRIGSGGMGRVYVARQLSVGRDVALKIIPPHLSESPQRRLRFRREVEAAGRLEHRGIVRVYSSGEHEGILFFAMQLVTGGRTLADWIDERKEDAASGRGTDGLREGVRLCAETAEALAHAHEHKILHRDIKPSNILIDRDGNALLSDFGLAKGELHPTITQPGVALGTPGYMSPEQVKGDWDSVDQRTDTFSLGVVLYEVATMEPAFRGASPLETDRKTRECHPVAPSRMGGAVPSDLEAVILKAMEARPTNRYQTAAEMAAELRRYLAGEPVSARRPGPLRIVRSSVIRHRVLGAFVCLVVAVVTLVAWLRTEQRAMALEKESTDLFREVERTLDAPADEAALRRVAADLGRLQESLEEPGSLSRGLLLLARLEERLREPSLEDSWPALRSLYLAAYRADVGSPAGLEAFERIALRKAEEGDLKAARDALQMLLDQPSLPHDLRARVALRLAELLLPVVTSPARSEQDREEMRERARGFLKDAGVGELHDRNPLHALLEGIRLSPWNGNQSLAADRTVRAVLPLPNPRTQRDDLLLVLDRAIIRLKSGAGFGQWETVWEGSAEGFSDWPRPEASFGAAHATGEFDGDDSSVEVALEVSKAGEDGHSRVLFLKQGKSGELAAWRMSEEGFGTGQFLALDLDGDGTDELVVADRDAPRRSHVLRMKNGECETLFFPDADVSSAKVRLDLFSPCAVALGDPEANPALLVSPRSHDRVYPVLPAFTLPDGALKRVVDAGNAALPEKPVLAEWLFINRLPSTPGGDDWILLTCSTAHGDPALTPDLTAPVAGIYSASVENIVKGTPWLDFAGPGGTIPGVLLPGARINQVIMSRLGWAGADHPEQIILFSQQDAGSRRNGLEASHWVGILWDCVPEKPSTFLRLFETPHTLLAAAVRGIGGETALAVVRYTGPEGAPELWTLGVSE